MAEPAIQAYSTQFHGRRFKRSRIRDRYGPGSVSYSFMEELAYRDVTVLHDDFLGTLSSALWTVNGSGSGSAQNFVLGTPATGASFISGIAGTTDDGEVDIISAALNWFSGNRAAAIFRIRTPAAVTSTKWEVGFNIARNSGGAVNVKATPTSNATNYAVVIRDTDDDTNVSIHGDGTTDAAAAADGSFSWVTNTWYDVMISMDENTDCRFWINSQYQNVVTSGPDIATGVGLWACVIDRDDVDSKQLDIDYVHAWQERVALGS